MEGWRDASAAWCQPASLPCPISRRQGSPPIKGILLRRPTGGMDSQREWHAAAAAAAAAAACAQPPSPLRASQDVSRRHLAGAYGIPEQREREGGPGDCQCQSGLSTHRMGFGWMQKEAGCIAPSNVRPLWRARQRQAQAGYRLQHSANQHLWFPFPPGSPNPSTHPPSIQILS